MKEDITNRTDKELSLIVFNNEYLYNHMHSKQFIDMIELLYTFTYKQLLVLKQDIELDLENNIKDIITFCR